MWSRLSKALDVIAVIVSLGFAALLLWGLLTLWNVIGWVALLPTVVIGFVLFQIGHGIRADRAKPGYSQDSRGRQPRLETPEQYRRRTGGGPSHLGF